MKKSLSTVALALSAVVSTSAFAANEVNIYSYRQPYLIEPILKDFEKDTGIKVNVIFAKKGLVDRVKREGKLSPADVLLTVDVKRLQEIVDAGLAQSIDNKVLDKNIPSQYHGADNQWFGLTTRSRVVFSSKDRVGKLPSDFNYYDLAKPEYKGKVCTRSGKHPYNVGLIASMVAHDGAEKAKSFLEGLKANLARKPQGNDRGQVKAIKEGICDYALGNSYYFGKMLNNKDQKSWAEAVYINFPDQESYGAHVNVSGIAIAKYAPNKENAIKLAEYLSGDKAQHMYAEVNYEYPVKPGVKPSELVASWGSFKADKLPLSVLAEHYKTALKLIDEVQFDL